MRWTEDMEDEGFESVSEEGKYLVEIKSGTIKRTKNEDEMWALILNDVESGKQVCWDNLVFSSSAKGIAFKKMGIMGVEKGDDGWKDIQSPDELIGMRFYVHVFEDSYTNPKTGKVTKGMKIKSDVKGTFMGYEPEFVNAVAGGKDDLPF